jgi:hypothetical protein
LVEVVGENKAEELAHKGGIPHERKSKGGTVERSRPGTLSKREAGYGVEEFTAFSDDEDNLEIFGI